MISDMYFIVGLGNPGSEHENTRHNVGFAAVDELASRLGIKFEHQTKLKSWIAKKENVVLVKPDTFMNLSGESVQKVIAFYDKKLIGQNDLRTLYVLHDDLDLHFGQTKLVYSSHPKTHNGLNSIRERLGTESFWYGRFGVDTRTPEFCPDPHEYVLTKFKQDELPTVLIMIRTVIDNLYALVTS